jgi:primosomal protein N'
MLNELKPIFEKIDASLFTEETMTQISSIIEEKVNTTVQDRVTLAVESALQEKDEEVTKKTQHLIETFRSNIDQDHTAKIKFIVEKLNEDHMNKLLTLKDKYDGLLEKTAVDHKNQLVEAVDRFFEKYIDENLPKQQIMEAAKNVHVQELLEQVRRVAGIDKTYIKENVAKGILDGKQQIDRLQKENARMKHEKDVAEARALLVEKTKNLPIETAKFVRSRLSNKSPQYIKENFNFVLDLFDQSERKSVDNIKKTRSTPIVESAPIRQPIVNEATTQQQGLQSMYLEGLKHISRT